MAAVKQAGSMRSSVALRTLWLCGCLWLFWPVSEDLFTVPRLPRQPKIRRFQAPPTDIDRDAHLCLLEKIQSSLPRSPADESFFENPSVGSVLIMPDQFEKMSEGDSNTVVSKAEYSQGSHVWHLKKLSGLGIRHRIGICLGNVSWDTNPAEQASDSSCWFYEDGSGSLNQRPADAKLSRSSSARIPISMYDEDELAIILDSDHGKLYYFWPTGEEGVIDGLPLNSGFRLFVSVEGKGDSWQVREAKMPKEKKVYADDTWVMRLYRRLHGL